MNQQVQLFKQLSSANRTKQVSVQPEISLQPSQMLSVSGGGNTGQQATSPMMSSSLNPSPLQGQRSHGLNIPAMPNKKKAVTRKNTTQKVRMVPQFIRRYTIVLNHNMKQRRNHQYYDSDEGSLQSKVSSITSYESSRSSDACSPASRRDSRAGSRRGSRAGSRRGSRAGLRRESKPGSKIGSRQGSRQGSKKAKSRRGTQLSMMKAHSQLKQRHSLLKISRPLVKMKSESSGRNLSVSRVSAPQIMRSTSSRVHSPGSNKEDPVEIFEEVHELISLLCHKSTIWKSDLGNRQKSLQEKYPPAQFEQTASLKYKRPFPRKVNKLDMVIRILRLIDRYISLNSENLGLEMPYDPKKFENDLKFFREWFRFREDRQKAKYDFFFGPYEDRSKTSVSAPPIPYRSLPTLRRSAKKFEATEFEQAKEQLDQPKKKKEGEEDIFDSTYISATEYWKDLRNYYMSYDLKDHKTYDEILFKFWGRITEMITGPEHEHVYLRRIIARFTDNTNKKADKVYLRRKVKANLPFTSLFWKTSQKRLDNMFSSLKNQQLKSVSFSPSQPKSGTLAPGRRRLVKRTTSQCGSNTMISGIRNASNSSKSKKQVGERLSDLGLDSFLNTPNGMIKQSALGYRENTLNTPSRVEEINVASRKSSDDGLINLVPPTQPIMLTQGNLQMRNRTLNQIMESEGESSVVKQDTFQAHFAIETMHQHPIFKASPMDLTDDSNSFSREDKEVKLDELDPYSKSKEDEQEQLLDKVLEKTSSSESHKKKKEKYKYLVLSRDRKHSQVSMSSKQSAGPSRRISKRVSNVSTARGQRSSTKHQFPNKDLEPIEKEKKELTRDNSRVDHGLLPKSNKKRRNPRERRTVMFQRGHNPMSNHFQTLLNKPQYQFQDKAMMTAVRQSIQAISSDFDTVTDFNQLRTSIDAGSISAATEHLHSQLPSALPSQGSQQPLTMANLEAKYQTEAPPHKHLSVPLVRVPTAGPEETTATAPQSISYYLNDYLTKCDKGEKPSRKPRLVRNKLRGSVDLKTKSTIDQSRNGFSALNRLLSGGGGGEGTLRSHLTNLTADSFKERPENLVRQYLKQKISFDKSRAGPSVYQSMKTHTFCPKAALEDEPLRISGKQSSNANLESFGSELAEDVKQLKEFPMSSPRGFLALDRAKNPLPPKSAHDHLAGGAAASSAIQDVEINVGISRPSSSIGTSSIAQPGGGPGFFGSRQQAGESIFDQGDLNQAKSFSRNNILIKSSFGATPAEPHQERVHTQETVPSLSKARKKPPVKNRIQSANVHGRPRLANHFRGLSSGKLEVMQLQPTEEGKLKLKDSLQSEAFLRTIGSGADYNNQAAAHQHKPAETGDFKSRNMKLIGEGGGRSSFSSLNQQQMRNQFLQTRPMTAMTTEQSLNNQRVMVKFDEEGRIEPLFDPKPRVRFSISKNQEDRKASPQAEPTIQSQPEGGGGTQILSSMRIKSGFNQRFSSFAEGFASGGPVGIGGEMMKVQVRLDGKAVDRYSSLGSEQAAIPKKAVVGAGAKTSMRGAPAVAFRKAIMVRRNLRSSMDAATSQADERNLPKSGLRSIVVNSSGKHRLFGTSSSLSRQFEIAAGGKKLSKRS